MQSVSSYFQYHKNIFFCLFAFTFFIYQPAESMKNVERFDTENWSTNETVIDISMQECPICFEGLSCISLECGEKHPYCLNCISDWASKVSTCPSCRSQMTESDKVKIAAFKQLSQGEMNFLDMRWKKVFPIIEKIVKKNTHKELQQECALLKNERAKFNKKMRKNLWLTSSCFFITGIGTTLAGLQMLNSFGSEV